MRQLLALLEKIRVRNTTEEYYRTKVQVTLARGEMPSLEEVLGVALDETPAFDEKTQKAMDEYAQKLLKERKAMKRV